jgi:hypothetical protein
VNKDTLQGQTPVRFHRGRHAAPNLPVRTRTVTAVYVPLLALAYVTVATVSFTIRPIVPGLDPSWVWAINELPYKDAIYGRDVIFSFGPLGYLFEPLDIGSNLIQAIALRVFMQIALVAVVVYHLLRRRRPWSVLLFLAAYLLATTLGLTFEHRAVLTLGMLLTVPAADRMAWRIAAPVAGLFTGVLVFTKLSAALAAMSLVALAVVVWIVRGDITLRMVVGLIAGPFMAIGALVAWRLFGNPLSAFHWIARATEFTQGYVEAMTVPGPPLLLGIVLATVVAYSAALMLVGRADRTVLMLGIPLAAVILLALRHGLVRHHGRFVPAVVLGALALIGLASGARRGPIVVTASVVVVASAAIAMGVIPACFCRWDPASLGPSRGWSNLVSLVDLGDTRARVREESQASLAEDLLPGDIPAQLRSGSAAVDVLPSELVMTRANGLRWEPNPVLQTYAAFTSELDRWVGRHFSGPERPEYLVAEFIDIDARHPMLTAPLTWRSVLSGYRPAEPRPVKVEFGEVLVLQQRRERVSLPLRTMSTDSATWGEWVEAPRSTEQLIFAEVRLESDLSGLLARLAWRIEPVYMDLALAEGGRVTIRVVPSTLRNGFLLNHLPLTGSEFLQLLRGGMPRTISAFRLRGPGQSSFRDDFAVVWRRAPWSP